VRLNRALPSRVPSFGYLRVSHVLPQIEQKKQFELVLHNKYDSKNSKTYISNNSPFYVTYDIGTVISYISVDVVNVSKSSSKQFDVT